MNKTKINTILTILSFSMQQEVVLNLSDQKLYLLHEKDKELNLSPLFSKGNANIEFVASPTDLKRVSGLKQILTVVGRTAFQPHFNDTSTSFAPHLDSISTLFERISDVAEIKKKMQNMVSNNNDTIYFRAKTHETKASFLIKNNQNLKEIAEEIEELFLLKQILTKNNRTKAKNESDYMAFFIIIEKNIGRVHAQELPHTYSQLSTIKSKIIVDINKILDKQEAAIVDKKVNEKFTRIKANLLAFILIILIFTGAWLFTSKSGNQFGKKIMSYVPEVGIELGGKYKPASTLPTETTSTYDPDVSINRKVYSKKEIVELIEAYQTKHNTKVWEQRRGFIFEEFANKKFSEWEAGKAVERGVNR